MRGSGGPLTGNAWELLLQRREQTSRKRESFHMQPLLFALEEQSYAHDQHRHLQCHLCAAWAVLCSVQQHHPVPSADPSYSFASYPQSNCFWHLKAQWLCSHCDSQWFWEISRLSFASILGLFLLEALSIRTCDTSAWGHLEEQTHIQLRLKQYSLWMCWHGSLKFTWTALLWLKALEPWNKQLLGELWAT